MRRRRGTTVRGALSSSLHACTTPHAVAPRPAVPSTGLVTKVVDASETVDTAVKMAERIASFSQPIIAMAKETVNASYELSLAEGLRFERRIFHGLFATNDQKEGMQAFVEKREAKFTHS